MSLIESEVQLKCGFWTSLPHLLCVLVHPWQSVARRGAVRILEQFAAKPEQEHHFLSRKFCGHGSELCRQLVKFAEGEDRRRLGLLQDAILPFAFIPVAERSCEGRHAIAKRDLDSNLAFGGTML